MDNQYNIFHCHPHYFVNNEDSWVDNPLKDGGPNDDEDGGPNDELDDGGGPNDDELVEDDNEDDGAVVKVGEGAELNDGDG